MPYVKIELTREGVSREQKQQLIKGVTDLITDVLNKELPCLGWGVKHKTL